MALNKTRRAALVNAGLPDDDEMRKRVREFLIRTGLSGVELGSETGYSHTTINLWLRGAYCENHPKESNSLALRATLKQYMDLWEISDDIQMRGTHYDTKDFRAMRSSAMNALERGTAYLIDGPPGTQKTWTMRQVAREINESGKGRAIYVYCRVEHTPQSFLIETCTEAGIPTRGSIDQLIRKLRHFLGNRQRTLLMVDEAQHLGHVGLEVLRQLLDLPPYFGVLLAGSHDLSQRLSHWKMEQWRSRLRRTHFLNGPTEQEAEQILTAELGRMSRADIDETIKNCRVEGHRDGKRFEYISARDLFHLIEAVQMHKKEAAV